MSAQHAARVREAESIARFRDRSGRTRDPWGRRAILVLLAGLVAAALLDTFGQHPTTSRVEGAAASLEVQSPTDIRGGLIFQARFTVSAHRRIARPALVLQRGWFESMSVNSAMPQPSGETSRDGTVRLPLTPLAAGRSQTLWIYFQVNPTNVGRRSQNVALVDGTRTLATIHRNVDVWP